MLHDADLVAGEFRWTVIDVCSPATLAAVVFYPAKAKNILVFNRQQKNREGIEKEGLESD